MTLQGRTAVCAVLVGTQVRTVTIPRGSHVSQSGVLVAPTGRVRRLLNGASYACATSSRQYGVFVQTDLSVEVGSNSDGSVVCRIPSSSLSLSVVNFCDVYDDSQGTLVVAGTSAVPSPVGGWRVLLASVVDGSHSVFDASNVVTSACTSLNPCTTAKRCSYVPSVGKVFCVVARSNGPIILSFHPVPGATASFVHLVESSNAYESTAIAFDTDTGANLGFVALNTAEEPTQLFKFDLATLVVTGEYSFASRVARDFEVLTSLRINSTARTIIATVQTRSTLRLVNLNIFGIHDVSPSVIDSAGSTAVTVNGEGFPAEGLAECVFSADAASVTRATIVNSRTLYCAASPSTATGSVCDTTFFNVRFDGRSTQATNVVIQRPISVALSAATSSGDTYVNEKASSTITVRGLTFIQSPSSRCVIMLPDASIHTNLAPVTFINTTAIECHVPRDAASTPAGAFIAYSHDGGVWGASVVPFAIVGEPVGLRVVSPAEGTSVRSASLAAIPPVTLHVIDANGNAVMRYDTSPRVVRCEVLGSGALLNDNSTASTSRLGIVSFPLLRLVSPVEGNLTLLFRHTFGYNVWSAQRTLQVLVGTPTRVALVNWNANNDSWVVGTRAPRMLMPSPEAAVTDSAGNIVVDATKLPGILTLLTTVAEYTEGAGFTERLRTQTAAAGKDGRFSFGDVGMRGVFGSTYTLHVTASRSDLADFVTPALPLERCMSGAEYGVAGSFTCRKCPRYGVCDGSTDVEAEAGKWRTTRSSYVFYDCSPPYAPDSCVADGCKEGYSGPRCSVCTKGYGHNGLSCIRCPSRSANYCVIAIIAIAVCVVIRFLVANSISAGQQNNTKKRRIVSLIFKQLLSHVQVVSLAKFSRDDLPSFLSGYFSAAGTASTMSPDLYFVTCELARDYHAQLVFTLLLPIAFVIVFAVVAAVEVKVARKGQTKTGEYEDEAVQEQATQLYRKELLGQLDERPTIVNVLEKPHSEPPQSAVVGLPGGQAFWRDWVDRFSVTVVVILFMLFPPLLQACSRMYSCEDLDYGVHGTRRVLAQDRSIDCDSGEYRSYLAVAVVCAVVYGVGIPAVSILAVKMIAHLKGGDMVQARRLFHFTTGGFTKSLWMWEGVILVRKAVLVVLMSSVVDAHLRTYTAMWAVSLFLALNIVARPWDDPDLSNLEALSLLTIALTFNLMLVLDYAPKDTHPTAHYTVAVAMLVVNVLMLAAFAWKFIRAVREILIDGGVISSREDPDALQHANEKLRAKARELTERYAAFRERNVLACAAELSVVPSRDLSGLSAATTLLRYVQYRREVVLRIFSNGTPQDLMELYRLEADVMRSVEELGSSTQLAGTGEESSLHAIRLAMSIHSNSGGS